MLLKLSCGSCMSNDVGEIRKPAQVFSNQQTLLCQECENDLLAPEPEGIIVAWLKQNPTSGRTHYERIYWCCKGDCDDRLRSPMMNSGYIDQWKDIPEVAIPLVYAKWLMSIMNQLQSGDTYSPHDFEAIKRFLLSVYPHIARNTTINETNRIDSLSDIPSFLGGLGQ